MTFKHTSCIRNAIERGNDPYYVGDKFGPPVMGPYYMLGKLFFLGNLHILTSIYIKTDCPILKTKMVESTENLKKSILGVKFGKCISYYPRYMYYLCILAPNKRAYFRKSQMFFFFFKKKKLKR